MKNKFEIKSHDGLGRLGKLNKTLTPKIFTQDEIKIAPNEGSSYNTPLEIAQWNVKQTLKNAEKYKDKYDIGVIQGSKYTDLRLKCLKKLEKIGYNGFLIANGDELLLHPKDLVNLIIKLKKEIKPTNYLIFSFAEPSFMPLLTYMGIDGFLSDSATYYSYINGLMTPTKTYNLNMYPIYENLNQKELENYNLKTLQFVIKEIQTHIKNKTLRNLVEERSLSCPQNISSLKILDKNHINFILENSPLY